MTSNETTDPTATPNTVLTHELENATLPDAKKQKQEVPEVAQPKKSFKAPLSTQHTNMVSRQISSRLLGLFARTLLLLVALQPSTNPAQLSEVLLLTGAIRLPSCSIHSLIPLRLYQIRKKTAAGYIKPRLIELPLLISVGKMFFFAPINPFN
ncbi:hypothetical protein KSW81_002472 [Nannochloris sp. 'desiccata']|nr:hypothetical protein KSW81_002472 [Chlorella desiccata (nom. nud.)]